MVDEGELSATRDGRALILDAEEVRKLAKARRDGDVRRAVGAGGVAVPADFESVLTRVLDATLPRAVEAATEHLRAELAQERRLRRKAEARVEELERAQARKR
jgi:hypothetical protein